MGPLRSGSTADLPQTRPLERFKPTTGLFLGWAGIAAAAFTVVYCAVAVHTVVGLRVALGAVVAGVVVWMSQVRPRATAYADRLRLLGTVRDVHVPYVLVDEVSVTQMLNVFVGDRRYVCIGIGTTLAADLRQRGKRRRQTLTLGTSRTSELRRKAEAAAPDQTAMTYQTFVVTRIEELVDKAKREAARLGARGETVPVPEVEHRLAVPELVALGVAALAFVVSLLL